MRASKILSAAVPVLVHCLPARAPSPRVPEVPSPGRVWHVCGCGIQDAGLVLCVEPY